MLCTPFTGEQKPSGSEAELEGALWVDSMIGLDLRFLPSV